MIDIQDFLAAVWGDDQGARFVNGIGKNGGWRDIPHNTLEEALRTIEDANKRENEVFFTVHLYEPGSTERKGVRAKGCRALYLDIDIRPDDPECHGTQDEAYKAVGAFLENTKLPFPSLIDSGHGLHLYWLFTEMLSEETWTVYARQLATICKAQGLKVDRQVTTDRARILRVPGSMNRKDPEHPVPCRILNDEITLHDPADIQAILDKHTPATQYENAAELNNPFLSGLETDSDPKRDREIVDLCLPYLSSKRFDDRKGWIDFGILLRNVLGEDGLPIWDEWSKQSDLYKQGECEERWHGFSDDRPDGEKLGIGSIVEWAKEDGGEKFAEVWDRYWAEKRIPNRYQLTDAGNAKRLIDTYGGSLGFDRSRRVWYVSNGRLWVENAWADVLELAKRTVETMRSEVARMKAEDDESKKKRDDLLKAVNRFDMQPRLEAMVKAAATTPDISVSAEDFNGNPDLLNVSNGTLDLRTGQLTLHGPGGRFTYCLEVAYDPDAKCPRFEKFMDDTTCGDRSLLSFLQKLVGYILTGHTLEEKFFVAHGGGQNGKGTLFEALEELLGHLSTTIRTSALMRHKFSSHSSHSDDIASLEGKRLVRMSEAGRGRQFDMELLKQLTGGGRIRASRKHQASFDFENQGKLLIDANDLPDLNGMDKAVERRVVIIPFGAKISDEKRDDTLKPYLKTDPTAQAAILAWAVEGSIKWHRSGLGTCDAVQSATAAFLAEQDIAANFIFERCERGESYKSQSVRVYEEFDSYCQSIGVPSWKPQHLGAELRRLGFTPGRTKSMRFWNGFKIRDQAEMFREGLAAVAG